MHQSLLHLDSVSDVSAPVTTVLTCILRVWCAIVQASRNEYGHTPAMVATQADCKEALSAVNLGGESARLKLAEDIEAAAAEAEAARLEEYIEAEER